MYTYTKNMYTYACTATNVSCVLLYISVVYKLRFVALTILLQMWEYCWKSAYQGELQKNPQKTSIKIQKKEAYIKNWNDADKV